MVKAGFRTGKRMLCVGRGERWMLRLRRPGVRGLDFTKRGEGSCHDPPSCVPESRAFNEDCELGGSADIFSLIARLEGLNEKAQFVEVLKRGYEILGLEHRPKVSPKVERPQRPRVVRQEDHLERSQEAKRRLELCHRVYARIMAVCPLEARDRKYLRTRGLSYDTIRRGRFGSISAERARHVKRGLLEEFGEEKLLSLPGFSKDRPSDRIGFTLSGDYLLILYHDRWGNITTIEGRAMGEVPEGMGKYVSLRGSGNHLYLFPGTDAEKIAAFTEGPFGAIVAAESGLAVGAIQGCERYKASFSRFAPDGEEGEPLLEISGVNFRGRRIPYIPDADDPPNKNVIEAAPKAAHHLIERQGGEATLCALPKGMDLDEWLLSVPNEQRHRRFLELISGATPLERAEDWKQAQRGETAGRKKGPRRRQARAAPAEHRSEAVMGSPVSASIEADTAAGDPENLPEDGADERPAEDPRRGGTDATEQEDGEKAEESPRRWAKGSIKPTGAQRLRDAVYRKLLERCPPKDEHKVALNRRGVVEEAVRAGRLGSLDPDRAGRASEELTEEFGAKRLLSVPGFERSRLGKVSLSLPKKGEYVLLPCFDGRGLVAAIEALRYDPERGELVDPDRTVALSGAGAHLYVFAPYSVAEIEGFCEGPLGAILAAQEDVVLGALGHFRRYAAEPGSDGNAERAGTVLPELESVDFRGRQIPYVPKPGPGEENARVCEARNACRYLVERQNGVPQLMFLSVPEEQDAGDAEVEGGERPGEKAAPTSLAERILALPEGERQDSLREVFPESPNRIDPLNYRQPGDANGKIRKEQPDGERRRMTPPEIPALSALAIVLLMAAIAAGLDLLLESLEAFGQPGGVGYGDRAVVEGDLVGRLRGFTRSAPLEVLYAFKKPVSLLAGIMVGTRRLTVRTKLLRLSADLSRFGEGPWRAHLVTEERAQARAPSKAPLTPREALEGVAGAAAAYALLYLALSVARGLYDAMAAPGMTGDSYRILVENSDRMAVIAAVACGLYVLARRVGLRKQRMKLIEGRIEP